MSAAPVFIQPDASVVVRELCESAGISWTILIMRTRRQWVIENRRRIAHHLRDLGYSYPEIGQALGGFHHSTIMALVGALPNKRK